MHKKFLCVGTCEWVRPGYVCLYQSQTHTMFEIYVMYMQFDACLRNKKYVFWMISQSLNDEGLLTRLT